MKQNMQDLTEGSLGKKILIFSVPLMLSNLLQVLFNMADIAVRTVRGISVSGRGGLHGDTGHHVYRVPHWSVRWYQCINGIILRSKR